MQFEGSIKEVLDFLKDTNLVPELKEKLVGAILAVADSDEMKVAISKMIKSQAEQEVRKVMMEALYLKPNGRDKPQIVAGWFAEDFKARFSEVLSKEGLRGMVYDAVADEANRLKAKFVELQSEIIPQVDTQVRALIPKYVTTEYRERVAEKFDETKIEPMIVELIQKSFGRMFMGGIGGGTT